MNIVLRKVCMKKILCLLVLLSAGLLAAGTVQQSYSIPAPVVDQSGEWHHVSLDQSVTITEPGMPSLPAWPVKLLLPPGERVVSVQIDMGEAVNLGDGYHVFPQQTPVPISRQESATFTAPDAAVYASSAMWPQQSYTEPITQYMRGYSIALFQVWPVQYRPSTGELLYYPNVSVSVNTAYSEESQAALQLLRGDERSQSRVRSSVDNPQYVVQYPQNTRDRIDGHLMVIITGQSQMSYFDDFVAFKTRQGFNPLVASVEEIESIYDGVDTQDRIRNFIKACYNDMNTEYVILGGDVQIIPHRGFYVQAGDTVDNALPADMYYSCLDHVGVGLGPDWNCDNDNYWGEPEEADYYPELAVGRISANNQSEFAAALNKQIMYQVEPVVGDLEKALMVGEQLNDAPMTWGGNYKDQIISGGTFDNFTTAGIGTNFDTDTMYERDGNWSRTDLAAEMNAGLNLLNHLGHSNTDYNMKFSNNNVTNSSLTANGVNHNFFLIYSQGCYSSSFDFNDAIAEKFTTIENGCGVYVGNSRYGWYSPGATNSSSQYMDRQFFDALFGEDITRVGDANDDSKVDGAGQCNADPWFRWAVYELNVLGDPSLDLWTATPQTLTPDYSEQIPLTTTVLPVATGAPNALICVSKDGEQLVSAWANANGNASLVFDEPFTDLGTLDIYISAHNYLMHTGTIQVISADQPFLTVMDWSMTAGDDEVLEFGESGTLSVTLKNIGQQPASNVTATLNSTSTYIDFTDDSEDVGTVAAGEEITLQGAFTFELDADVPDQQPIPVVVQMTDGNDVWQPQFVMVPNAPELGLGNIELDDANGSLDPGETVDVEVWLQNNGHADLHDLAVTLQTADPYITINQASGGIDVLDAYDEAGITFSITVSNEIEIGHMASFTYHVEAEMGVQFNESFVLMAGNITEDFESGDLTSFDWETSGDAEWYATSGAYEGSYCARSGSIGNNASTTLSLSMNVLQNSTIGFQYKVSCENDNGGTSFDHLAFLIDGQEQDRWDGEIGWTHASFPVTAGEHTFSWTYEKDTYVQEGQDCAWIDVVEFPPFVGDVISVFFLSPPSLNFGVVPVNETQTRTFSIFNMGEATMVGSIDVPDGFSLVGSTSTRKGDLAQREQSTSRTQIAYSVEPSQLEQFQLTFAPTAEGNYTTDIVITSNDPYHSANALHVVASTYPVGVDDDMPQYVDALLGNHPNPFNPTTTVSLSVAADHTPVRVDIYNVRGQKVLTLCEDLLDSGNHELLWRGQDSQGAEVGSGVYFVRSRIGEKTFMSKMLMLK